MNISFLATRFARRSSQHSAEKNETYFLVEFLGTHEFAWVLDQNTFEFDAKKDPNWAFEGDPPKRVRKSTGVHLENDDFALGLEQAGDTMEELTYRSEDTCGDDIAEAEVGLNGQIPPEGPPKFDAWADGYDKDLEGGFEADREGELLLATFGDSNLFEQALKLGAVGSLGKPLVRRGAAAMLKKKSLRQRPEATFGFSSFSAPNAKDEEVNPLEDGEKEKVREPRRRKRRAVKAQYSHHFFASILYFCHANTSVDSQPRGRERQEGRGGCYFQDDGGPRGQEGGVLLHAGPLRRPHRHPQRPHWADRNLQVRGQRHSVVLLVRRVGRSLESGRRGVVP